MSYQSADKILEFIFDIGLTFIPYSLGLGFLYACGKIIQSIFRDKGRELISRLFGIAILFPIGAFLLIGSFLAMHEQFGLLGCAIQIPVFLILSLLIVISIMKINREKEHHEEKQKQPDIAQIGEKRWKRILAACFDLILILAFFMAILKKPLPLFDREHLARLMKIEFLVIHSFFFLGLIVLPRIRIWQLRVVQWFLFLSFLCLYISVSLSEGMEGVRLLLPAALATYMGALLNALSPDAMIQMLKRWIACFAMFVILSIITRMPDTVNDWGESPNILFFGLFYFLVLGILEYSGAYQKKWRLKSFRSSRNRFPARVKESNLPEKPDPFEGYNKWRKERLSIPMDNPDLPVPFGFKCCWFAVKSDDLEKVVAFLNLSNTQANNWFRGIENACRFHKKKVFISPPVKGWIFIVAAGSLPRIETEKGRLLLT